MRSLSRWMFCSLVVFGVCTLVQATDHAVTLTIDQETSGDLSLVMGFTATAADGDTAPRALRGIMAASVGEIHIALKQRIDGDVLILDDGSSIVLLDEDTVTASMTGSSNGARLFFKCSKNPSGTPRCVPDSVCLPGPDGNYGTCISIPRGKVKK